MLWLENGGTDELVTIADDGRDPYPARWLVTVLAHSDEALTARELRVFEEWLCRVDALLWTRVRQMPRSTILTFRTVAGFISRSWLAGRHDSTAPTRH